MTQSDALEKLDILLVDDQESKLLSYEVILDPLGERLLFARSGVEALETLLRNDVAVVLIDVSMPGLDGFELAAMIREHPRFEQLAIIFVSAIHLSVADILHGYEKGAVDYVPVPIVPELLRAKVSTFLELRRKTRELERLNQELEDRVKQRTEALEAASIRQELLAREVDHRARNALAVVQAIIGLTRASDVKAFSSAVHGRIRALGHAHQLLSNSRWNGADIASIVLEELAPFNHDDRVSVLGPPAELSASAAQMFALAVHELATNAVKYGALSNDVGRVEVTWTVDEEHVCFAWRESGGPVVSPPLRRGFGTTVVEQSMAAQLKGDVKVEWRPEGLTCTAAIPRRSFRADEGDVLDPDPAPVIGRRRGAGDERRRVLVVEDEVLVAMDLSSAVEAMGYEVVGPLHSLSEALAAGDIPVDLAILDVNLRGEEVFPLADRLAARGVPIIFLTGYDREMPRLTMAAAAVLQKPFEHNALSSAIAAALAASPSVQAGVSVSAGDSVSVERSDPSAGGGVDASASASAKR